jgi:hypothetical protein
MRLTQPAPDALQPPAQLPLDGPPPPPPHGTMAPPPVMGYPPYGCPPAPPEGDATGGIVPYKNPNALMAYYAAVFAVIPGLGLILGPVALFLGLAGLRYYKQYPVVKGVVHAWIGIVGGAGCCLIYLVFLAYMLVGMFNMPA